VRLADAGPGPVQETEAEGVRQVGGGHDHTVAPGVTSIADTAGPGVRGSMILR
jgi:hypothetical protein